MASATVLPVLGTRHISISGDAQRTSPSGPNMVIDSSASYWAALISKNLETAQAIRLAGSDTEGGAPLLIDEEIMNAPRRKTARDALACDVAARLYPAPPGSLAPIIQYEKDVVMLRQLVLEQRRSAIAKAAERNAKTNWVKRIGKQGPWDEEKDPLSLKGAPSLPMPVEQSEPESLAPFFAHLAGDGTHEPSSATQVDDGPAVFKIGTEPYYDTELIEFDKGVLYADGRVDLCKMVTGPRNIGALMESLKTSTFSKHFLLGNNIVGPTGANAIADFIHAFPERFETWYLAGNCIDCPSFSGMVDAMVLSPAITNVWLKRNPLGPSAAEHIYRLITQTPNLRTLDLDQTEIGDEGVARLFGLLATHAGEGKLPLRNIYLNACGVGANACKQIAAFLRADVCQLEGLYLCNNPIGDGIVHLASGLKENSSLRRLLLQSSGLKDPGIVALSSALDGNESLTALDIGQGYATEDLDMRYNWVTDESNLALAGLIARSKLEHLNLSYTALSQTGLKSLLAAVSTSFSLLWFQAKISPTGSRDISAVKAGQEGARLYKLARQRLHENVERVYGVEYARFESEHKRFLVSPRDVRLIDSVYRNRDAGAARRGLKRLEKWWEEGDETLKRVADGSLA